MARNYNSSAHYLKPPLRTAHCHEKNTHKPWGEGGLKLIFVKRMWSLINDTFVLIREKKMYVN